MIQSAPADRSSIILNWRTLPVRGAPLCCIYLVHRMKDFAVVNEMGRGWVSVPVTAACTKVVARHVFVVCECVLPWTAIETNYYVLSRTVCQFPVESAYSRHLRRIEGWIFHKERRYANCLIWGRAVTKSMSFFGR